ncbi:Putative transposase (identified by ISEscan HMM) [Escherichia coli]|nr:Putative transposase (identified by ISEscan HMM) [Escherichia coli]
MAFIIDVFAGYIVGWRVSSSMETTFVLDALEHGPVDRPARSITVIKVLSMYRWLTHSGLAAGLLASTGSTGDS